MKAFLIPGSGEGLHSRNYQAVLNIYKKHGYRPQFININWKYHMFDDWLVEVKKQASKKDLSQGLLSGFSWGAMLALATAVETNPKHLLLFSLSPYFAEDMPLPKNYIKWAGKRRVENFKKLSFNDLAKQVHCPTAAFLGSKEKDRYADMWHRSSEVKKRIQDSKLILVDNVGHDVANPTYIRTISNFLS